MAKSTKSGWNWRAFLNLVAFVAIACIGVSLLVGKLGLGSVSSAFKTVAEILAYSVTAVSAFYFAHSKRHWAYFLIWIVCVILIIVLMII